MLINGPKIRGSACACTSHQANCPTVGITQHAGAAERNTISIPATVFLYSFICVYRRLQGSALVLKGQVAESSAFNTSSHFKVSGLKIVLFSKIEPVLFNGHFSV
jgi:hypothetical protein